MSALEPFEGAVNRELFENHHCVMFLIDPSDGRIMDANPAACAYYGWSRAELKARSIHDINTLPRGEVAAQMALAADRKRSGFSFRHRRADGSIRDVEVHSGPIVQAGRTLLFSIIHDVTDRNEIQRSLAESERRLATLMANLPGMAYRCRNDRTWTMLFVSEGCLALTGYPAADLQENRRLSYNDLIHPEDREPVWNRVQESLARREPFNLTYRIRTAADEEKWVMERGQGVFAPDGTLTALEGFVSDITQLKRMEEALRQSETKFRLAFQTSPDAVNLNRLSDGRYIDVNEGFTRLTGFTREETIGRTSLEIAIWADPRDRERLVAGLRERGGVENLEARFRRRDGEVGIGLMSARVLTIDGEEVILSVTRDITARKRVQDALRESEERYRQIVEAATVGILVRSGETIIYANPAAVRMLGASDRADLVGRSYLDLVHPEDRAESAARLARSEDAHWIAPPREHRLVGLDGRTVFVQSTGVPVRFRGEPQHVGLFVDLTERRRAEQSQRESERKYRELAESLPQGIFEIDTQGRLIYFNRTGCRMFGLEVDEIPPGFNVLDALVPEDRERAAADIRAAAGSGELRQAEYTAMRRDGTRFPVGIQAVGVRQGEKNAGLQGLLMDLAPQRRAEEEKRRLESQLQQAQKMEAIGVLAGGIAHDFNNILAAIIGYIELARLNDTDSRCAGELGQALAAAQRARELVKQILVFSRQGEEERMPVRVAMVVKEAVRFLRATIPATVEIQARYADPQGTTMANSVALHQIVMNLCTNAVHALGGRPGRIEIEVASEPQAAVGRDGAPALDPGPYVRITVADTGCGMTPEVMERIFDPYFTTKEKGVGTGLGLAVVHGIVAKHGGTVRVASRPGEGSRFDVYLPRVEAAPVAAAEAPQTAQAGTGRILFVDDEKMLAEIADQALSRLGYQVECRTSPIEALELFRANPRRFDLVITDQTMPGMTGEALASELVRLRPDLPIILCTGYSETLNPRGRLPRGIRALVMKPILIRELGDAVRQALAG